MKRITRINIGIFLILSLVTLFINFLKYGFTGDLSVILMILSFNISLGVLTVLIVRKIVEISQKGYRLFVFYLILVSFFYWYLVSSWMHWYYGSFINLGGLYYFIATRTYLGTILFYAASGVVILISSLVLFYFTRHHVFENLSKKKMNKRLIALLILTPLFVLIIVMIIIPKGQAYDVSPVIDAVAQYVLAEVPDNAGIIGSPFIEQKKVLGDSINIKDPNVIIIMLESISSEYLPNNNAQRDISPNINELAKKSIVFEKAYGVASHSDYAQTSFLSSRYTLINSYRNFFNLNYPRVFIWDVLKENNYSTAYISSQDDNWANMIDYYNKENLDVYNYSLADGHYDYGSGNAKKDYDEYAIEDSIQWINQTSGPFFLYTNLQGNHYPYSYPENNSVFTPDNVSSDTSYFNIARKDYNASLNRFDNALFYTDKQVGKLIDFLKEKGLFENSIIILSADHGEILERRHGYLRHGFGVYEEEMKVPLMIYIPGEKPRIVDERVKRLDVIPSILNISGFNLSEEFQGEIMKENQEIFLFAQNQNFKIGLISGDIKYILDGISYIPEAYNLTEDPLEQDNLIKTEKDERFYYYRYGYKLMKWYNCQKSYYKKEAWKKGKVIDC